MLPFVPSEAAEGAQILSEFLDRVVAESVFERAKLFVGCDVGGHVGTGEESIAGLAITAHVGSVGVEENAGSTFAARDEATAKFQLAVLSVRAAESPVHVNAVGDGRHG